MKRIPLKIVLIFCLLLKIDGHSQVVRIWASGAKGNASDRGEGLSIDKNNNTYLTGYYQSITSNPGEFVFGKDSFQTAFRDCFLIKFDANGNRIWARSSVGGYAWGTATATAEDNNIYITGLYEGNITFGTFNFTTIANAQDIFLAKYDQNGKQLWASSPVVTNISGYNIYNAANAVATDKSNNVYLTGSYEDQIAFGSFTLPKNPSTPGNMFLVKYGPTGNVIWAKYSSGTGTAVGNSVVTDAHNNIYVSGYFTAGTAIFGSCNVTCNTGSGFYFLTKYDSNGNAIWARTLSNAWKGTCPTPIVSSTSITIDKYNNPIIGGTEFMDSIRIGSFTLGKTKPILFTAKYDTGGNVLWAKSSTGGYSYLSNVLSMTTDKCGNIYFSVQVRVSDSVRYGSTLYKGSYVEELDSLGNSLKGIEVTNSVSDQCNVLVAIDNWGNAIIGGEFVDTLTAGKDSLKTSGGRDYPFNMKTLFNNNCCHAPQLNITGSDSVCRSIGKQVLKVFPLGANYVWSN
ncbi:MAG TPA: hypothetical protein VN922_16210, partial [Bacteroidia bacterium]|nr:hypothetical protein [Bacteroidia bacterium]